jgi:hypothetical protein
LAGCGGAFTAQSGSVRVDPGAQAMRTGEQLHLAATSTDTGDAAPVHWKITGSNNAAALGAGSISPEGVYTAPGVLSRDAVTVSIAAESSDATANSPVIATLTVVPGFAEPLQPENATLAPGSAIEVRAQLAEVGSGSVLWSLQGSGGSTEPAMLGSLSGRHCDSGPQQFTACTVTYSAPQSAPAGTLVWLVATTRGAGGLPGVSVRARLQTGEITSDPTLHQLEQPLPVAFGGSGGNDNDFDTYKDRSGTRFVADCCGGTLGALVEDQSGTPYILSNNHVLAASDQGRVGDTIEQPGLIDDGCVPLSKAGAKLQPVGTLRYAVPLDAKTGNVDAALASVNSGTVDVSGAILELGPASFDKSLRSAPPVSGTGEVLDASRLDGLTVVKSGRTTGLTCSTVDAVDLRVTVDYYKDCAESRPYTSKTFTGQIGIGGEGFADSGDSGALVLDSANARAVGLLFATGTAGGTANAGLTLVNPIGDVLAELGARAGSALSLHGTPTPHSIACLRYDAAPAWPDASTLTPDERARVTSAIEAALTLRSARILAVAAGASADEPGRGAVLVYVDRTQPSAPVPETILGVRTVIVPTDAATIARGPVAWPAPAISAGVNLSAGALSQARSTADQLGPRIMQAPGVFGVGVAESLDSPSEPALLVLVDADASRLDTASALSDLAGGSSAEPGVLPAALGGLRVRYMVMHRLRVTQSKYVARGGASSCSLRSAAHGGRVD